MAARLDLAGQRTGQAGREVSRAGKGDDVGAHRAVGVEFHVEGFLSSFRVTGERAVGETDAGRGVGGGDDPARRDDQQRTEALAYHHGGPGLDRRVGWGDRDPRDRWARHCAMASCARLQAPPPWPTTALRRSWR